MTYKILKTGINGGPYISSYIQYQPTGEGPSAPTGAVISKIVIHNYASSSNSAAFVVQAWNFNADDVTNIYAGTLAPGESFEVTGGITLKGSNGDLIAVGINQAGTSGVTMGAVIFGDEY